MLCDLLSDTEGKKSSSDRSHHHRLCDTPQHVIFSQANDAPQHASDTTTVSGRLWHFENS